jgi:2-dehydro-3-deoxyphosphogluconate aldolase / (4S)-4-hydroxy-2-oxoglutarate aldolase
MSIDSVIRKIGEVGVVPVVRAATFEDARLAIEAICAGGVTVIEVTMTVPNAVAIIREVVLHHGDTVLTGAGTVTTAREAEECLDAGAEFLMSPGLSVPVLHTAAKRGKLAIPGAMTPTELMAAHSEQARLVKIFPCSNLGGPKFIQALRAPFPHVSLIPTGGVNLSNAEDYILAGAFALGVGADLVDAAALREGNSEKITDAARNYLAAVRRARDRFTPRHP